MPDIEPVPRILRGNIGSPGIAVGLAYLVNRDKLRVPMRLIMPELILLEKIRFQDAVSDSRAQLGNALARDLSTEHRQILEAHKTWIEDPYMISEVERLIQTDRVNAEWATKKLFDGLKASLSREPEATRADRCHLFDEVCQRIMRNLMGVLQESLETVPEGVILVAHYISPGDMAHIDLGRVIGMATNIGGPASHISILARGMELPSLVGLDHATGEIHNGDLLILDAIEGKVIVNPTLGLVDQYQKALERIGIRETELLKIKDLPSLTADGKPIKLSANLELPHEVELMVSHGIHDVGLYRSEYIFLTKGGLATEEEQFQVYAELLKTVGPEHVVTIRTLDVGSDKLTADMDLAPENNPAMGLRAIRFCLEREDVFKDQLRALLRASIYGQLRIMFPMISGLGELRKAKEILDEVKQELEMEGFEYADNVDTGIMIEVPSAVVIADILAEEADFFSIGTNDLIQYTLAVDRTNEHVSHLFTSAHPAILRLIRQTVRAGRKAGIEVSMCGEMAGDIQLTMLLIGLGVDSFSANPASALKVKELIRKIDSLEAEKHATQALEMRSCRDLSRFIRSEMSRRFPEIFREHKWTI